MSSDPQDDKTAADPVRPQETLRDRIAEVIHLRICGCGGTLTDRHFSGPYIRVLADAVLPIVEEETRALREQSADRLLTHVGGDEAEPWQAGHNYAMREAARLIREGAAEL